MPGQSGQDDSTLHHEFALAESAQQEAAALTDSTKLTIPTDAVSGYDILDEIGRGGMGVVYRARQAHTKQLVAVKILLAGWFASPSAQKRFQREVELAARCQHAGIVRVLGSGYTPTGQQYYAMDYVAGVHLDNWIARANPDLKATMRVFGWICEAVEHAHSHHVIHRDLKPANILIDAAGKPHILDFGLSKAIDRPGVDDSVSLAVSAPGQIMGTLRYLSPEQAAGDLSEVDTLSDVYALGVMMFEALTGTIPYDSSGSPSTVMARIRTEPPLRPSSLSKHVDRDVETIILKCIEKEKARRYPTVRALREDVERYLHDEPIHARPPSRIYTLRKRLTKWRRHVAVAALVLIIGAAGLWGGIRWSHRPADPFDADAVAAARRTVLRIQCELEEQVGSLEERAQQALAIFAEHPDLTESRLVWAKASFRLALLRGDVDVPAPIRIALTDCGQRGPVGDACVALLAEMQEELGKPSDVSGLPTLDRDNVDSAEAWYVRSYASFDATEATQCTRRAVERDPTHLLAWRRLASLYMQTGDTKGSLDAAQKLVELSDRPAFWITFQGRVLVRHGLYRDAIEKYTESTRIQPTRRAYRSRAIAYLCLDEYEKAIEDYSQAADLHPSLTVWERYQRATPLWILGRTDEAAADYKAFVSWRGFPTFADARLALIRREQGRDADAARVLRDARATANDTWLLSVLTCLAGDLAPDDLIAIAQAKGPVERERRCEAFYYAGESSLLKDQPDQAREFFRQCVDTGLAFDPHGPYLDAMNEYHLARWRLRQLSESPDVVISGPE